MWVIRPPHLAAGSLDCGEKALELGEIHRSVCVGRARDVIVDLLSPQDLAVGGPDGVHLPDLVDHVEDPMVHRGRKLDELMGEELPQHVEGRVGCLSQVVGALGKPPEDRPVDIPRAGRALLRLGLPPSARGGGFAATSAADEEQAENRAKREDWVVSACWLLADPGQEAAHRWLATVKIGAYGQMLYRRTP